MRNFKTVQIFLYLALSLAVLCKAEPGKTPAEKISDESERILRNIKKTQYKHVIEMNENKNEYITDCSGLVIYVLEKSAPDHLEIIRKTLNRNRLTARDFCNFFNKSKAKASGDNAWQKITNFADVKKGDIIAYKSQAPKPGNTGHVVIADSESTETLPGVFKVAIIDSTTKPHADDTRKEGQTGIGRGVMLFETNKSGYPVAFRRATIEDKLVNTEISVGRALPVKE